MSARLASIDRMRGFVMVLMALDHASIFFNAGRVAQDTAATYIVGTPLPPVQFFARWVTHLCAPTFVFLAGTALALSAHRRTQQGQAPGRMDRDMLIRGLIIAGLEVGLLGSFGSTRLFSVLFAIGCSMMLMVPLRRLPDRALVGLALAWFAGGEWVTSLVWQGHEQPPVWAGLLLARTQTDRILILYPVLHWLPLMMLGWTFGNRLAGAGDELRATALRTLLRWGSAAVVVFVLVRGLGGYGNMFLPASDNTLVQWLHVSKYPPSLAFVALELSLMALILALLVWFEPRVPHRANGLLLVLGQTALFFYMLHFGGLAVAGVAVRATLGVDMSAPVGGLATAAIAASIAVAVLYPACVWFRGFKRARPNGWVRFF